MGKNDGDVAISIPSEVRFLQSSHEHIEKKTRRGVGNTASFCKKYSPEKEEGLLFLCIQKQIITFLVALGAETLSEARRASQSRVRIYESMSPQPRNIRAYLR